MRGGRKGRGLFLSTEWKELVMDGWVAVVVLRKVQGEDDGCACLLAYLLAAVL